MTYSPSAYYGNELGNLSRIDVVNFLFSVQGSICSLCGKYLRKRHATIDHVVPRSRGGAHHILNWALAHRLCNEAKGNRMPTIEERARHAKLVSRIRRRLLRIRVAGFFIRIHRILRWRPC